MTLTYLHTMVRVNDLEASMAFYALLGLRETRRIDNDKGRFSLVFMAPPGQEDCPVELTYNWDGDDGLPSDSRHFGHLAYRTSDIYALCQHLMDNGVTINRRPAMGTWPLCGRLTIFPSNCCRKATTCRRLNLGSAWAIPATGKAGTGQVRSIDIADLIATIPFNSAECGGNAVKTGMVQHLPVQQAIGMGGKQFRHDQPHIAPFFGQAHPY